MPVSYRIVAVDNSETAFTHEGEPLKELTLTDLNSNGNFLIKAIVCIPKTDPQTGIIISGPENWLGRYIMVSSEAEKPFEKWEKGDILYDSNPYNM